MCIVLIIEGVVEDIKTAFSNPYALAKTAISTWLNRCIDVRPFTVAAKDLNNMKKK